MRTIALQDGADFDGWRLAARALLNAQVPPAQVTWVVSGEATLFAEPADFSLSPWGRGQGEGGLSHQAARLDSGLTPSPGISCMVGLLRTGFGQSSAGANHLPQGERQAKETRVPAAFMPLAESLICHRDPQRYGLAYRLLWRLTHGERSLLQLVTDPDVRRAREAEKSVRRDSHKMKAFVRFREVQQGDATIYVAWFEPDHYIVERVAPFFVRRFTGMAWSLLTPYRSAHWDGSTLQFGSGATKADAPTSDAVEDYWRTYYASIFNPARLKVQAMKSEMPMKYWKNLPEAALIPELIRNARPRTAAMIEAEPTAPNPRIPPPKLARDQR